MSRLPFAVVVAGVVLGASCKQAETAPANAGPVACANDADCRPPPCGPCASGTVITQEMLLKECVVNECTGRYDDAGVFHDTPLAVVCSPSHVCTIR